MRTKAAIIALSRGWLGWEEQLVPRGEDCKRLLWSGQLEAGSEPRTVDHLQNNSARAVGSFAAPVGEYTCALSGTLIAARRRVNDASSVGGCACAEVHGRSVGVVSKEWYAYHV